MSLKSDRIKNTRRNAIWGIVNKFITILLPFITRTVLIYVLGVEYRIASICSSHNVTVDYAF